MELDSVETSFVPQADRRARIPEPPPVRLVTVDDAHLSAPAGAEVQLNDFYVNVLQFERQADCEFPVYRAENFRLVFDVLEPPISRDDFRPIRIEVPSLQTTEQKLIDAGANYTRQRGLMPGDESLVLLDPAGNWVEITEGRTIR
jgi:catechol 2,3-dioxygenase-like lactoylglutathione lyase family enzyme